MVTQDWEGKQLDKDLLGSKIYSTETCCFVPSWLNNIFIDSAAVRGNYPIGVNFHKQRKKFVSKISVDGKRKHIGLFESSQEAHKAYCEAKLSRVQELMENYPDQRIKQAVLNKAQHLYGEPTCVPC